MIVADGYLVRAVCAAFQRQDVRLFITPDELAYGLRRAPAQRRLSDANALARLIAAQRKALHPVIVVLRRDHMKRYRGVLPEPNGMDIYGNFVLLSF
ncbi:hypothetical protein [Desulfosarcina cetonica]|uniref:hypothetical protein n=1 Tax=Desulfosarcina cetonica TaxID=90730 RepID=UPI0006CF314A|nr:hypothetical protein [Desulfosarcina cetonica]